MVLVELGQIEVAALPNIYLLLAEFPNVYNVHSLFQKMSDGFDFCVFQHPMPKISPKITKLKKYI